MDQQLLQYDKELKSFLDESGKLTAYPVKYKKQIFAMFYLAEKFESGIRYTEKEINSVLEGWHTFDDWAMLRRDLYDRRFLDREQDGSSYWKPEMQPTLASFGF